MNHSLIPRRRWLIGAVALSITSITWSPGPDATARSELLCERARKKLVSLLHEPERARKVGAVYLRSPAGRLAPPRKLVETVLAEMGPDAGTEVMPRLSWRASDASSGMRR